MPAPSDDDASTWNQTRRKQRNKMQVIVEGTDNGAVRVEMHDDDQTHIGRYSADTVEAKTIRAMHDAHVAAETTLARYRALLASADFDPDSMTLSLPLDAAGMAGLARERWFKQRVADAITAHRADQDRSGGE
jgi:hypothetical protein